MEKIDTDYKRRIWKIEAKLFNMRKPWLRSFMEAKFYSYKSGRIIQWKSDILLSGKLKELYIEHGLTRIEMSHWSVVVQFGIKFVSLQFTLIPSE